MQTELRGPREGRTFLLVFGFLVFLTLIVSLWFGFWEVRLFLDYIYYVSFPCVWVFLFPVSLRLYLRSPVYILFLYSYQVKFIMSCLAACLSLVSPTQHTPQSLSHSLSVYRVFLTLVLRQFLCHDYESLYLSCFLSYFHSPCLMHIIGIASLLITSDLSLLCSQLSPLSWSPYCAYNVSAYL